MRRSGHVLQEDAADLLVYEGDAANLVYEARTAAPAEAPPPARDFDHALLAAVNAARALGDLAALTLAPAQSASNARLAGTLIDATMKSRASDADRITLGLGDLFRAAVPAHGAL